MQVVVPINYVAVLLAAVASLVLGLLWYGPLFGKQSMAVMGMKGQPEGKAKHHILALVGALVMSGVLAHMLVFSAAYMRVSGIPAGISAGMWSWLGFVAPVTLGSVLWEGRPWKLWILNNAYQLVSLLLMGAILGAMPA